MGYVPVAFMILLVAALVMSILLYFGNRKTSHWYAKLCAFIAWLFPFSIMLMLPIDLSSVINYFIYYNIFNIFSNSPILPYYSCKLFNKKNLSIKRHYTKNAPLETAVNPLATFLRNSCTFSGLHFIGQCLTSPGTLQYQ